MSDRRMQEIFAEAGVLMRAIPHIRSLPPSQRIQAFIGVWDDTVRGSGHMTFSELLQLPDGPVVVSQDVADVAQEMVDLTEDATPGDVMRRALGIYAAIVRHVAKGGRVVFEADGQEPKTLKVRVKA